MILKGLFKMKKLVGKLITAILIFSVVSGCATSPFADDAVPRMSKEELKQQMGAPDIIILDEASSMLDIETEREIIVNYKTMPEHLKRN